MRPHKLKIAVEPSAEIAAARSIVQGLQARQKEIDSRLVELRAERESLSFTAIVEIDAAAKARLDEVTSEAARLTLESENVASAIREAEKQAFAASKRAEELNRIHCAKGALKLLAEREKLAGEIETAFASAVPLVERYVVLAREIGDLTGKRIAPHYDGLCVSELMNRLLLPLVRSHLIALPSPSVQLRKPFAELSAHGHSVQRKWAQDVLAADAALVAQNGRAA